MMGRYSFLFCCIYIIKRFRNIFPCSDYAIQSIVRNAQYHQSTDIAWFFNNWWHSIILPFFIILRIRFRCFAKVEHLTKVMWPKNRDFRGVQDSDDCNPTYFPSKCHEPNKLLPKQAHVVILQFHLWGLISWPGEFVLLTSSGVSQYRLNNFCFMPCIIRIIQLSFYHSTYH